MANILLVEDDQFIREIYNEILTSKGHTVTQATNGEDGYSKIKSGAYDLILLDIIMPGITGIEVVKKLNSEGMNLKSSVIFSTNSDSGKDIESAKELGAGYIIKSNLNPDDFEKTITDFLQKKKASVTS